MPELPELEVVCEVLQRRVAGQAITDVRVLPPGGPIVVRDLTGAGFEAGLTGATIEQVARRGKFLVFSLQPSALSDARPLFLALNCKLTGRLQLAGPGEKLRPKTHVMIGLAGGQQLRYFDLKRMGQLYLTHDLDSVPDYTRMGPEALEITLEEFRRRLRPLSGEIKGVLARGSFVAGIGNAYADEILWAARLNPFRKVSQLSAAEVDELYAAMRETLFAAIEAVRAEMQEAIEREPRDFMAVHMKTGQPCPRCGGHISLVGANERITNFCRTCQPGGLIKGME